MPTTNQSNLKPAVQVLFSHTLRFAWLTIAMACGIVVLLTIEAAVLWRLGIDYVPKTGVATAGVSDFAINDTSRWAISRIAYTRNSRDASLQNEIVLHDMRQPDHPIRLGSIDYPRQVVISAHSGRFAIGCYDGSIFTGLAQSKATSLIQLARLARGASYQLACSPDGQLLAAADPAHIYLWRIADGKVLWRTPHTGGIVRTLLFASDAQSLLSVSGDGQVCLWQASGGQLRYLHETNEGIEQATWSPDSHWIILVLAGSEAHRRMLNLKSGEQRSLDLQIARCIDGPVAVSRDGARFATVRYTSKNGYCIELWDSHAGERVEELWGGEGKINGLLFAADGTLYAWNSKGRIAAWSAGDQRQIWSFCALNWARTDHLPEQ